MLDNELLAKAFRQPLPEKAGDNIGRSAGRIGNDPAYRPRGKFLRPRDVMRCGECGSGGCEAQKMTAGRFQRLFLLSRDASVRVRLTPCLNLDGS